MTPSRVSRYAVVSSWKSPNAKASIAPVYRQPMATDRMDAHSNSQFVQPAVRTLAFRLDNLTNEGTHEDMLDRT